jgi:NAD(P)-dependent dehydrogenase (short-subunit alcohol dehydrogenase family)
MEDARFLGKVAVVTGSSRGIGSAIALKLAQQGADVVVTHRTAGGSSEAQGTKLCETIRGLGRRAALLQVDISVKSEVKALFIAAAAACGGVDFLVLNAARAPFKPLEKLLERDLRQLVDTNYLGNLFCIQEALPFLAPRRGKVVFVSSLGSRFYNPSYPLGSMKAALEAVMRDCAESLKGQGIAFNAVCGGIVKTDSFKVLRQVWDEVAKLPEELFVEPEELADVVAFLCGAESRGICGQTLVVDRGFGNRLYQAPPAP